MNNIINNLKKPLVFALAAGLGCLAAAIIAELFLYFTLSGKPPQSICLTIDVSGSMAGSKMDEIKGAAKKFVGDRNLSRDHVAIAVFSSAGQVLAPFTRDKNELVKNIDSLIAYGGTNFEDAVKVSKSAFESHSGKSNRVILLFTDGANSVGDARQALTMADGLRKDGVQIFAIGTQDADMSYLTGLTGLRERVISARDGNFGAAFAEAERLISPQLMSSSGGEGNYVVSLLRVGVWTAILCIGIALALVAVQNHFLRKQPLLPFEYAAFATIASVLAGLAAGAAGQVAFSGLSTISTGIAVVAIGRLIGWTILGALLARGTLFFIPNLNAAKAWQFGAGGGLAGVIGFLFMTATFGEIGGRLLGAFILGAAIGLLVALVETLYRNVWLMVLYDPR